MFQQPMQFLKLLLFLVIAIILLQRTSATTNKLPLVINTWGFLEANKAAWNAFYQKNVTKDAALYALVEGCSKCENLQCDGTVGFGGSPDENGETTLDAMIMDGATMNMGAVAGMRHIKDAIKVARHVLENTQHSLLVGEAATNFAKMMGFRRESLSTLKSTKMWLKWVSAKCQPNFWINVKPDPRGSCGPYKPIVEMVEFDQKHVSDRELYSFDRWNHDTIGMIVIDEVGRIYAGTSTNGANHKIPGRVGDSPIPGSGAYADNEIGAAVATGDGDIMMRFSPSLLAVEFLRNGKTPQQAAQNAMQRIVRFYPKFSGGLIVADRFGNYSAACVGLEQFPYSVVFGKKSKKSKVENVKCNVNENEQEHDELK